MSKLDKAVIDKLQRAMYRTWSDIGYDVVANMQECGERLTNSMAVEMCIDADRLKYNGGDIEADVLVMQLCTEHGYTKVLRFLSKNFKLV
jgi:hypothetical protein